jgi:hypothetical protein
LRPINAYTHSDIQNVSSPIWLGSGRSGREFRLDTLLFLGISRRNRLLSGNIALKVQVVELARWLIICPTSHDGVFRPILALGRKDEDLWTFTI